MEVVYEIKKSRFIAWADYAASREEAMQLLDAARRTYPDARHHCWAYWIGSPRAVETVACSDDGEPGGTAGKPILNVLQHKAVGHVMLVVSRYFGGIKLGAGGLVRAYGHAAQLAMEALPLTRHVVMQRVVVSLDFAQEQALRHWLAQTPGQLLEVDYQQQVRMTLLVPAQSVTDLKNFLAGTTARLLND